MLSHRIPIPPPSIVFHQLCQLFFSCRLRSIVFVAVPFLRPRIFGYPILFRSLAPSLLIFYSFRHPMGPGDTNNKHNSPGSSPAPSAPPAPPAIPAAPAAPAPPLPRLPRLPSPSSPGSLGAEQLPLFPQRPRFPLTWHDRRGERRSCEREREQALLDEESTSVIGGEGRGLSACLLRSRLASSRLSHNYCALSSGHTSAHPLRARLLSPHPVMPALAPPAIPTPTLSRGACAFPSGHGSDRHACGRLLWSHLRP